MASMRSILSDGGFLGDNQDNVGWVHVGERKTICIVNETMAKVPEEFFEDTDLQTLAKTCRLLRRLCKDTLLWRSIHLRSKDRVNNLLFKFPQRPTRENLAASHILRGRCLERKLSEGQYVGGDGAVRAYEAFMRLQKEDTKKNLRKGLEDRPGMAAISAKNLIPEEASSPSGEPGCSPRLMPKVVVLKKAMTLDLLKKQLRTRISVEGLKESGLAKTHTVTNFNPSIHGKAVELDKKLCEIHLVSKLVRRPSASILEGMKVLQQSPSTAAWICPPIKDKLNFYEKLSVSPDGTSPMGISPDRQNGFWRMEGTTPSPERQNGFWKMEGTSPDRGSGFVRMDEEDEEEQVVPGPSWGEDASASSVMIPKPSAPIAISTKRSPLVHSFSAADVWS
ncbi:hypothetical protein HDU97_001507 [Phlyctochytrium planicorne]|nr:hypothetical protein HDU97_001507 [Phlyctochytrium planicorne]